MGLAQVYGIVKQHEGYIDVASEEGGGTTFIIYLPILGEHVEPALFQEASPTDVGQGETILVVDDDKTTRQAVGEILESLNYRILLAADGQEALTTLEERTEGIDLVISEVVMPSVGGAALYEELREMWPDLPMVVITRYPLDSETHQMIDEGNVILIQKPLSSETLAQAIRKVLTRKA